MKSRRIFTILLLTLFMIGCDNDKMNVESQLNGEYTGIFTVKYEDSIISNPVTVTFQDGTYTSSASNDRIPAGGNGTFRRMNDTIEFKDRNAWTADFDWGLILSGPYALEINDSMISIHKSHNHNTGYYKYELKPN